jgi:hypothetical protein
MSVKGAAEERRGERAKERGRLPEAKPPGAEGARSAGPRAAQPTYAQKR